VLALAFASDLLLQIEPGKQKIQKTVLTIVKKTSEPTRADSLTS
jgi:hypothetical protein